VVAFRFDISKDDRIATITVKGPVDLRACVRALGEFVNHPHFDADQRVVVDLREMAEFPASLSEMRVLAWTLERERASFRGKVAIVLPQDTYAPRLDRLERLNSLGNFSLAAFPDISEAEHWVLAA